MWEDCTPVCGTDAQEMRTGFFFFFLNHWFKASALHRKLGVYMGSLMPLALLFLQIQAAHSSRNLTTREYYQRGHCPHIMRHILDLVYMVVFLHFFYSYGFNWVCVQICPKMIGSFFLFFYLNKKILAEPHSMWALSSLTREWTCAPCTEGL